MSVERLVPAHVLCRELGISRPRLRAAIRDDHFPIAMPAWDTGRHLYSLRAVQHFFDRKATLAAEATRGAA